MSLRDKTRMDTKKAIDCGIIKKPKKCSSCGIRRKLDVHHLDYKDHLNVIWFCKKCHHRWHKENVCLSIEISLTHDEAKAVQLLREKEHRTLKSQIKWMILKYIKNSRYANILEKQK